MAEADHILADAQLRARMGVAVMTLARQRATTQVKEQFRAQGLRVAHMSHREIVVAAEEYLAEHPELIADAKPTVLRWFAEGVFGKRAAQSVRNHSPRAKPTNTGEFNDERRSADHGKPNTAPFAERSLPRAGVFDGGRG